MNNEGGYGTVSGSCTATVSLVLSAGPTGIFGITVFPNPTSERLILKNEQGWHENLPWTISDVSGRALISGSLRPGQMPLSEKDIRQLPTGTYLLRILEGERKRVWKFVKE